MIPKFRKKPVVIEAIQWDGENHSEIFSFVRKDLQIERTTISGEIVPINLVIETLEGEHRASKGDWIIKGVNGEFYPCKPDIFEKTYERVDDE